MSTKRGQHNLRAVLLGTAAPHPERISSDWRKIVWIFITMSVLGMLGETCEHYVMFNGELVSRAGALFGPFSPLYGLAAVLFTFFLEPMRDKGLIRMFLLAGLIGGVTEYFASWAMESFWGIVSWSYLTWPLNFDGRTCVFYMCVWGILGTLWATLGLDFVNFVYQHVHQDHRFYNVLTKVVAILMAIDLAMTVVVMIRTDAHANGIAPQNAIEQAIDDTFTYDYLQNQFGNMGGIGIP